MSARAQSSLWRRRPDLDESQIARVLAAAQQDRQIVRLLDREAARNLPGAADDRLADDRRRDHLAVEHDRERAADVLLGGARELAGAGGIEPEADHRLVGALIEAGLRVGEV